MLRKFFTTLLVITVLCCLVITGCSAKNPEEAYYSRLANVEPPQNTEALDLLKDKVDTLLKKEEIEHEDFYIAMGAISGDSYIQVVMLTDEEIKEYPIVSSKKEIINTIVFDSGFYADKDFIRTHREFVGSDERFIPESMTLYAQQLVRAVNIKLDGNQFVLE